MRKFWSTFFLAVLLIVSVFFVTSLVMANIHNQSMVDEWKSWLPEESQEEVIETEESEIETDIDLDLN